MLCSGERGRETLEGLGWKHKPVLAGKALGCRDHARVESEDLNPNDLTRRRSLNDDVEVVPLGVLKEHAADLLTLKNLTKSHTRVMAQQVNLDGCRVLHGKA